MLKYDEMAKLDPMPLELKYALDGLHDAVRRLVDGGGTLVLLHSMGNYLAAFARGFTEDEIKAREMINDLTGFARQPERRPE